jgi:hypothetical protein
MGHDSEKHLGREVRMLMRHPKYRRYVCSLPGFSVEPILPERFVKLLRELDRVSDEFVAAGKEKWRG